nr:RNA-dependent RNA polymerase [Odonatan tombus-related virus]
MYGRSIFYFPSVQKPDEYIYYPNSSDTTYAALSKRHLPVILPEYIPSLSRKLYKHIKPFVKPTKKFSRDYYISTLPRDKQKLYQQTAKWMDDNHNKHSPVITPFTKIEKMTRKYKAPRLIQARHPTFNIKYGCYIKPIEIDIKNHVQFSKGNYRMMAMKINEMKKKYKYYTEIDHTTFDAHVTVEHLRLTHMFYSACHGPNAELRQLSKQTIRNNGKTRDKIKYKVRGTRMSGDVDTSLGNSLINYAIIKQGLEHLKIKGDVIVNGDDSIIFSDNPIDVTKITQIMKYYNMETKCKETTTNIYNVEFCQHKLIITNDGVHSMMPNTARVLNRFGMTYKTIDSYHAYLLETLYASSLAYSDTKFGTDLTNIYQLSLIIVLNNNKTKKINKQKNIKNLHKKIKKLKRINRDLRRQVMNQKQDKGSDNVDVKNNKYKEYLEFNYTQVSKNLLNYYSDINLFRLKIIRIFSGLDLSLHDLRSLNLTTDLISHDLEIITRT